MLRFHYPELLILAIPLAFAFWRWGRAPFLTGYLRLLVVALLLLAAMGPEWNLSGRGVDVIVVADRSRSMPSGTETRIRELIVNLQRSRRMGDRIGIVTFGAKPARESLLATEGLQGEFTQQILPDGSDLNAALHSALDMLNEPDRPARILVFSDGESNGVSPRSAARRARDRGVPIDFREFPRARIGDVAVDSLQLPETIAPREPFQYTVWISSPGETRGRVTVLRDGQVVSEDQADRRFDVGLNRFMFRDILETGGLHNYEVRVQVAGDPLDQNNRGEAVVRVEEGPRALVLNADGREDNLTRAIRAGNIPVDVAAAGKHPLTQASLDRYRAVILENIPANDLGRLKMARLAQFVEDLGGGLLITGGERSFGNGGYYRSPLEEILPVSLEMREEHRKTRVAVAIVLDRSGSMMAPVGGGKVKMDLADLGTAECVRMLSPGDAVAVIAVDSSPHVIQHLTDVTDPEPIARKVLKIQSEGGGIFVYEGLVAGGKEVSRAVQSTKHIILFSDAADSEQPGDYINLLKKFESAGITVSVIGLGTKKDSDAKLLEDIAKRGRGNIMFTDDAKELPRLFAQETMSIARSSFIKKDPAKQPRGIAGANLPGGRLMGEVVSGEFPHVDGYNLTYLRPQATQGVISEDEYKAPFSAFWHRGLGRVAALTVEADGVYSGEFGKWKSYSDFAITQIRWLLGQGRPDNVYVSINRDGQDAVVSVEFDPDEPVKQTQAPTLHVIVPGEEREKPMELPFQWRGSHELEARFRLSEPGTYLPLVRFGGNAFIRTAAVSLPYSPEYSPRTGLPAGGEILKTLAELTGGKPRIDVLEVLADPPRSARMAPLLPWLLAAAALVLLLEIAGRRLSLWTKLEATAEAVPQMARRVVTSVGNVGRSVLSSGAPAKPKRAVPTSRPAPEQPAPAQLSAGTIPPPPAATPPAPAAQDVYDLAKRRARRRHD